MKADHNACKFSSKKKIHTLQTYYYKEEEQRGVEHCKERCVELVGLGFPCWGFNYNSGELINGAQGCYFVEECDTFVERKQAEMAAEMATAERAEGAETQKGQEEGDMKGKEEDGVVRVGANMHGIIAASRVTKARLLHYFSQKESETIKPDDTNGADADTDAGAKAGTKAAGEDGTAESAKPDDGISTAHAESRARSRSRSMSIGRARSGSITGLDEYSSWCGWHNDHGSLTGLIPGMFLDAEGRDVVAMLRSLEAQAAGERKEEPQEQGGGAAQSTGASAAGSASFSRTPPPFLAEKGARAEVRAALGKAGLYICARSGEIIKAGAAPLPANTMLFQIGETAQIHSGGIMQATPHAVQGITIPVESAEVSAEVVEYIRGISRESFACFMEPEWGETMSVPNGMDAEKSQSAAAVAALPAGCPALIGKRWGTKECPFSTCNFGTFSTETYKAFLNE